ncbi:MAG: hypothetical protein C0183_05040 [Roseiflexus castenholzii]|uniref:hypothetical protein n=1 Tax=Roseiflexus castenholzii TaxID=120962 RepID=UPI000CBD0EE8|nr:MAG: hypothetical protein C0183_05040 [Roseiflexus castenholzii]
MRRLAASHRKRDPGSRPIRIDARATLLLEEEPRVRLAALSLSHKVAQSLCGGVEHACIAGAPFIVKEAFIPQAVAPFCYKGALYPAAVLSGNGGHWHTIIYRRDPTYRSARRFGVGLNTLRCGDRHASADLRRRRTGRDWQQRMERQMQR